MNCDTGNLSYVDKVKLIAENITKIEINSDEWNDNLKGLSTLQEALLKFDTYKPEVILSDDKLKDVTVNITEYPTEVEAFDNKFIVGVETTHAILKTPTSGDYTVALPDPNDAKHKVITLVGDNTDSTYLIGNVTLEGFQYGVFILIDGAWTLFHKGLVAENIDKLKHIPVNLDSELASIRAAANLTLESVSPQEPNSFPNGTMVPDTNGSILRDGVEKYSASMRDDALKIVDKELNDIGIEYVSVQDANTSNDQNKYFVYDLGTERNGQYMLMSFLEYNPDGVFSTNANNHYIGANGGLNGGGNADEITYGSIQLSPKVKQRWKHCKIPDNSDTHQAWVGGHFNTPEPWYMTGLYVAFSDAPIDPAKNGNNFLLDKALNNYTLFSEQLSLMVDRISGVEDALGAVGKNTNIVKNAFGAAGEIAGNRYWTYSGSVVYYEDPALKEKGYPSVFKASQTDPNKYYPRISAYVSKQDLINGGIQWDAGAPLVSMKAGIVKSLLSGQVLDNVQIFFDLRYGSDSKTGYDSNHDVLFASANTWASYLGAGDHQFDHTVSVFEDDAKKTFAHNGIVIPETYNGMDFKGIVITILGYPADENNAVGDFSIGLCDLAVIEGDTIEDKVYFSMEDTSADQKINNTITIHNSDKIVLLGDSYSASHYTMKDKAYISRLSELMDWRFENYSKSGDDYAEMNQRFLTNAGVYHPTIALKDYGATYGLLISFTNDIYARGENIDLLMHDIKRTVETVKSFGIKPLISNEFVHLTPVESMAFASVTKELDIPYIDIASNGDIFNATKHAPYWGNGHPAARTNILFVAPLLENLKTLGRPNKSIKIYRNRDTVSSDTELLYNSIPERIKKWKEISVGHHALDASIVNYYDELDQLTTFSYEAVTSEYLKLQNNEQVSFDSHALIEVILPTTQKDCEEVTLKLSSVDIDVYCKNNIVPLTYDTNIHYQGLEVDTMPTVSAGDVYSFNNVDFTVVDTVTFNGKNMILCTPYSSYHIAGGTATKVSGVGDSSFNVVEAYPAREKGYYSDYNNKGTWKALTNNSGEVTLRQDDLRYALDYDKLIFMLKKTGGFDLTDVSVVWKGEAGKDTSTTNILDYKIDQIYSKEAKDAILTGGAIAEDPNDGVLPKNTTKLVKVDSVKKLTDSFIVSQNSRYAKDIDIVVWARYNPPVFPHTGDYTTAPITSDTVDYRTLTLSVYQDDEKKASVEFERLVGTHWEEVRIPVKLLSQYISDGTFNFDIYCSDGEIEIAYVEIAR